MIENLIVFDDDKAKKVLEDMGFRVGENGEIFNENGERMKCPHCGEEISIHNVGGIFPGSKIIVCDNLGCVLEELDKQNLTEKLETF